MAIAGSLVVTVQAKTSEFEQGMRKVRTEVQATQKAVTSAQAGFQGLTASLAGLAAGVLSVQALSAAMRDVVKVGVEMQNLRQSFAAISGGAQAANREFQFVVQTANKLGLELQSVAGQYRNLSAATKGTALEGVATRDLFTTLARAAQTYGLSTEQTGRALTAFQQIVSKGKVSMEELRGQLGEALPGAMQIAARAFGTTTKGLEDLIAKGLDATEFTRRFTTQLSSELPTAAAKAGAGFAQLGNEILLLKDRMAQSGLLAFLDAAAAKLAGLYRQTREQEEALRTRTEERATTPLGTGVTLDKLAAEDRQRYLDKTRELIQAEADLAEKRARQGEGTFLGIKTQTQVAKERVEALRQEQQALALAASTRAQQEQAAASRLKELNEPYENRKAIIKATTEGNKALTTTMTEQQAALDKLNKSAALTPELYGKAKGSLQEEITFLEKRKALNEKYLETLTESRVARSAKAEPIPPELTAQLEAVRRQLREDVAGIAQRQQAIKDAAAAERKAIQDTEAAKRKAAQEAEATRRLDLQQAEEVARVHAQNIETLRRLSDRYTSVRADRDADTASMLQAALATSQYADEARRLAKAIEDVQRIEAQLPGLRSEAKTSAAQLDRFQGAMADMQPNVRLTRQEELQRRYEEFARTTSDQEQLQRVRTEMETTLHVERFDRILEGLERMGEAAANIFTEMAVTGEINLKKVGETFGRMALEMVADAIDLKGMLSGLLKDALGTPGSGGQSGSGLLGSLGSLFGGGGGGTGMGLNAAGGATSGTLPTTWGAYESMSAAGMFGGGMAAGGPVMPGRFYTVGERGPETLVAGAPGTIIPNGGGGMHVTMHIATSDADSFRRNERQISTQATRMLAQARRNL